MDRVPSDQPVIRTFSNHLRFLQFSAQVLLSLLVSRQADLRCSTQMASVATPLCIVLLILNSIIAVGIKFGKVYNRRLLLGSWVVNLLVVGVLMVLGLL